MKSLLSIVNPVRSIPHLRIQLPHRSKTLAEAHTFLASLSEKSPALFVSLIGRSESAEVSTNLYNLLRHTSVHKKVPVYTFLEDHVNGLTYYIASGSNFIDPFCRIGDLTVVTKSYSNVSGLLKYFGIDYKRIGTNESSIWNRNLEASEQEKEFTKRWLKEAENSLRREIGKNRKVSAENVEKLGSKLLHPREALEMGLVDEITTLEDFKAVRYPNNRLNDVSFALRASDPEFSTREVQVLGEIMQWMSMPRVALIAMEDPILEHVRNFVKIVEERMCSDEKMEDLDILVGKMIGKLEGKIEEIGKFVV